MSTTPPNTTSLVGPKNAWELCEEIGADKDEGVEVALFPVEVTEARLGDSFAWAPGVVGIPVFATCGEWGERLIDVVTEPSTKVKWWKVRNAGRELKVSWLPVSWQGPVSEIPEKYFSDINVGIRFFNDGPWFWPLRGTHLEANLEVLRGFNG